MNKYGARKTNGFHSKRESLRATALQILERCGAISDLRFQVKYEVVPKQEGERAVYYFADFVYVEEGAPVVEDSKGFKTPDYVIKRKLMLHVHGIRIRES